MLLNSFVSEVVQYYSAFSEYISLPNLIWHCLGFAMLFFFASIGLMIIFRKFINVQRKQPALKWMSKIYFILIPLWCLICGFKYGILNGFQVESKRAVEKSFASEFDNDFKVFIQQNPIVGNLNANQIIDAEVALIITHYSELTQKAVQSDNAFQRKVGMILYQAITAKVVAEMVKSKLKDELEKTVSIDRQTSGALLATRFKEFADEGIFIKIVNVQIDTLFGRMKNATLMVMFLVLSLPIIEIVIANYQHRKMIATK